MPIQRPADARPVGPYEFRGFNGLIGHRVVAWRPGFVEFELNVRAELCNANGLLHGGVLMTLLDGASGFACTFNETATTRRLSVTLAFTTQFIKAAREVGGVIDHAGLQPARHLRRREGRARHVGQRYGAVGAGQVLAQVIYADGDDRALLPHTAQHRRRAAALGHADVDGDIVLAAVDAKVVAALALHVLVGETHHVAAARLFDLDDARPQVGEQGRAERAGKGRTQIENRDAF